MPAVHPDHRTALAARVVRAAEAALPNQQYVSAIDILTGIGFLQPVHVQSWRRGRIEVLDSMIQANPNKVALALALFCEWALEKGLKPSETPYVRSGPAGVVNLQFSDAGNPAMDKIYRTHFVSPSLSPGEKEKLETKLAAPPQPVVFQVLRDSTCSACGVAIGRDGLLMMEAERPLCLECAGFGDDFEYLPAGDAALTRRASKYSSRTAVVVRFSRSRGRYERQGLLVEVDAMRRAEQECSPDAEARVKARANRGVSKIR